MTAKVVIRTRLSKQDSRDGALAAARALLIEQGPQAVTLKAVAAKIGRTHANVLHHFGSAHGLQKALATDLAERITAKISNAVVSVRRGDLDPQAIVDLCFDAFSKEGAGPLASWMMLTGDMDALSPILKGIHSLIDELATPSYNAVTNITLALVLTALGDALLGGPMAEELNLPRDTARKLAFEQLIAMAGPNYGKRAAA